MSTQAASKFDKDVYEIRIKGHLSCRRVSVLEGWQVKHQPNGETLLLGPVPDQAALYGILNRLRDLGVTLLAVMRVEE